MIITISGSMHFAKEMLEAQKILEENGHQCFVPLATEECLSNPELNVDFEFCSKNDCQMDHYKKIEASDAILVLNHPKNNLDGYIGGSVLTEMAIAKFLGKQIFVLNNLPSEDDIRYVFEIKLMQPTILGGDLEKIKNYV
jgi:hypothetical protein